MHRKILLYGPNLGRYEKAYGGGVGGYTRKMGLYLNHFHSDKYQIIPSYHTVKGQFKYGFLLRRFVLDYWVFFRDAIRYRPDIVHILAQYRTASPREFAIVFTSWLLRIPVVYEVKAGVFVPWFEGTNPIFRSMVKFCLRKAKIVLCQGMPYVEFLKKKLNISSHFYPNFVPDKDIPKQIPTRLEQARIRILFVGFAYSEKGVFELVNGCLEASKTVPIQLTFVGKLHPDFKSWLDQTDLGDQLEIVEKGVLEHQDALLEYQRNDIYCYPTRHPGEGHNNSINEAMMHGLVIITTRQGFLGSILHPDICYFLDAVDEMEITKTLLEIQNDRPLAQQKAKDAHQHLLENYTSSVAFGKLKKLYDTI